MAAFDSKTHRIVSIGPGEIHTACDNTVIQTLLGSCIAACIFDPITKVYGMNHFLLAIKKQKTTATLLNSKEGYYGIHAMELLINGLLKKGAFKNRLKAKIFGGGNVLQQYNGARNNYYDIGRYNIEFVNTYLKNEKIPIVASCVGQNFGRIIYFDPSDFSVYQKRISHNQELAVAQEEFNYAENQKYDSEKVHLW